MSALQDEDEQFIQLLHPMVVKTIPNFQTGREQVTVTPLCAFAEDAEYIIDKKNVLFIKDLGEKYIEHYINVVREHGVIGFTPRDSVEEETEDTTTSILIEGNDTKH